MCVRGSFHVKGKGSRRKKGRALNKILFHKARGKVQSVRYVCLCKMSLQNATQIVTVMGKAKGGDRQVVVMLQAQARAGSRYAGQGWGQPSRQCLLPPPKGREAL